MLNCDYSYTLTQRKDFWRSQAVTCAIVRKWYTMWLITTN